MFEVQQSHRSVHFHPVSIASNKPTAASCSKRACKNVADETVIATYNLKNSESSDAYYDLGSFTRPVSTNNRSAQLWFSRGLIWAYGFNHHEAAKCFQNAIDIDAHCAMAYWGLAYSIGPHLNKPWETLPPTELSTVLTRAYNATRRACEAASRTATSVEKAIIHALESRYPHDHADQQDFPIWSGNYVDAMRAAYEVHPDDLEVATLFADAMLNHKLYYNQDLTSELESVFERALSQPDSKHHPGILHMYVHFVELSDRPERAIKPANYLRGLVPDAGHLEHMPTHIDLLVGDYKKAIASNLDAVRADEKYLANEGFANFYSNYRIHNYHSLIYAAMLAGESQLAFDTVPRLEASLPATLLQSNNMADRLETFLSVRVHVLIRFGKWSDILALPFPTDQTLYSVTTAMTHYGKGIAFAATGDVVAAERQQSLYLAAVARVPASRVAFPNNCHALLAIGVAMLAGELAYRRGALDLAYAHLRRAVRLDDALVHNEPWGWMQPTRHALAALLLEAGRVEEALDVFRQDLGFVASVPRGQRHPNNIWALRGLHECLVRMDRVAEAEAVVPRLRDAQAKADIAVSAACFCSGAATAVESGVPRMGVGEEGE